MKKIIDIINEDFKLKKKGKIAKTREYKYYPQDNDELRSLIEQLLEERGKNADLNDIDVSSIQDFCYISPNRNYGLFYKLDIGNIDISEWDMSNATNISYMFYDCKEFNCDLSEWAVSSIKDMSFMFAQCENFNSDLSNWDVSDVEDISYMFIGCKNFNSDLSTWNVSKVKNMKYMFTGCKSLKNKPSWYKE